MILKQRFAFAALFALFFSVWYPTTASSSPVLLSFDVEDASDEPALQKLNTTVPATYFFTGKFALDHKALVQSLAKPANTFGSHSYSHPHFKSLDDQTIKAELAGSKNLIESISGKPVKWFRAPYLEYDSRVMHALKSLGYIGDSSDKDSWAVQDIVYEMPISNYMDASLIASDYDMIDENKYTARQFEDSLKKMYLEKEEGGEPLVVLLHPRIAAKYPDALQGFIKFVTKRNGRFLSFENYRQEVQHPHANRQVVWLDLSHGVPTPESLRSMFDGIAVSDVFLMAKDEEGTRYYGEGDNGDIFGKTLSLLKSRGVKVHAWISALADRKALESHPAWGMTAKDGQRSTQWMSPANPEVASYTAETVRRLLRTYKLDGVCLDNLAYPNAEYDYSPQIVKAFGDKNHPAHTPTLSDLMNDDYTSWCIWRGQLISDFAGKIRKTVKREGRGAVRLSSTVSGDAAIDYRKPEISGQDIAMLDRNNDFLVADIMLSGTDGELDKLKLDLFAIRFRAGRRPIILRVKKPAEGMDSSRLSATLDELRKGSDGIGFISGKPLFEKETAVRD
ncbi:MAG: polysaccharide deacetylase family protein [Chlorobiaceae bacterium]|nr:polysaccharide deacetylase family protein [Chlorobiaceae bacterium]